MLDMGFAEDLEAILAATPADRQTALFSATMAPRILAIAKRHLREPVRVTIAREVPVEGEAPKVREVAYIVQRRDKVAALARVLDMEDPTSTIVFCRTRTEVDELTETLGARGYRAEALHGGLSQEQRDRVMRRFREGVAEILVATDVAARGLDIENLSHVVNFDVPASTDAYTHRVGRTGRAGREGVAITLAEPREHRMLRNIQQLTKRKIPIESVPTVHDLRAHRLELTRSALEDVLASGGLDTYRVIVESLAEEHDILDLAAAAVKLADDRDGERDEREIAVVAPPPAPRPFISREPVAPHRPGPARSGPPQPRGGARPVNVGRIYIGLGRLAGIRPADLVGAIANEAGLTSREIGPIQIGDKFSLVGVPAESVDRVIASLRGASIRGKKVLVRHDRFERD
jgi:ATP-dependent RNA helicase DeaD